MDGRAYSTLWPSCHAPSICHATPQPMRFQRHGFLMEMIFRTQTFSTALGLDSEDTPSPHTPLVSYLLQSHSQRLRQTCTNTRMHHPMAGPAAPAVHPPASASAFTLLPGLGPLFLGNFKGSTDLEGVGMGWWISALVVRPRFFPVLRRLCPC